MKSCPEKRCPRCGEKGHNLYNCTASKVSPDPAVGSVNQADDTSRPNNECTVLLPAQLDGRDTAALTDSGAGPSVMFVGTFVFVHSLPTTFRRHNVICQCS